MIYFITSKENITYHYLCIVGSVFCVLVVVFYWYRCSSACAKTIKKKLTKKQKKRKYYLALRIVVTVFELFLPFHNT